MDNLVSDYLNANEARFRLLEHKIPVFTCQTAAAERRVPLGEMVKCVLLVDKKGQYFLVCVTADKQVDTLKVRDTMGSARLSFATPAEISEILGYDMGAVPPLLLKRRIPVLFDKSIVLNEKVNISSGHPKAGLELQSADLIRLANPIIGDFAK